MKFICLNAIECFVSNFWGENPVTISNVAHDRKTISFKVSEFRIGFSIETPAVLQHRPAGCVWGALNLDLVQSTTSWSMTEAT